MNKLDTDEIFNSFFEKDNNGDYDNSGIKQKDNPNPLLNMTYETLCVLRSYLTDDRTKFWVLRLWLRTCGRFSQCFSTSYLLSLNIAIPL